MNAHVGRLVGWSVGWSVTPCISETKHTHTEMEIRAEAPWPGGVHRPNQFGHAHFFEKILATPTFPNFFKRCEKKV